MRGTECRDISFFTAIALVPFPRITDSALGVGAAAADGAGDADVYESDVGVESDY